jgi:hypothetical protein
MGIFSFIGNIFSCEPLVKNVRKDVILTGAINQIHSLDTEMALKCVEIGDYIQWNEVVGVPNTPSFAGGRTVYGIVTGITEKTFEVIGIGYYGRLGKNRLQPTHYTTRKQVQNPQSGDTYTAWNGIDCIIKKKDIVWED